MSTNMRAIIWKVACSILDEEFLIDLNLPAVLWSMVLGVDLASNRNEYQEYSCRVKARGADLTTLISRMSGNLGSSTSWKPKGL
jgi:hypothetical protein